MLPPPKWCTDNGVMIAWAGVERCGERGSMEARVYWGDRRAPLNDEAISSSLLCHPRVLHPATSYVCRMRLGLMEPPVQECSQAERRPISGDAATASSSLSAAATASRSSQPASEAGSQPAPSGAAAGGLPAWDPSFASSEESWVELRPRWPLTNERHAKCMPENLRSAKKARLSTSLSDMTAAELAQLEARAGA